MICQKTHKTRCLWISAHSSSDAVTKMIEKAQVETTIPACRDQLRRLWKENDANDRIIWMIWGSTEFYPLSSTPHYSTTKFVISQSFCELHYSEKRNTNSRCLTFLIARKRTKLDNDECKKSNISLKQRKWGSIQHQNNGLCRYTKRCLLRTGDSRLYLHHASKWSFTFQCDKSKPSFEPLLAVDDRCYSHTVVYSVVCFPLSFLHR